MIKKLCLCSSLLVLLFFQIRAEKNSSNYIFYTPQQMQEHKKVCLEQMRSNPLNQKDSTYQMNRALKTVSGDDADYIPKVVGAGEIFRDEGTAYQLMHNGVKVILNSYYDSQWLTDVIYGLKGHHEPQEEKCFHEVLKYIPENATMIELGAYWAYYSLWFSDAIPNAKNYMLEPDPQRLEIGKRNFSLNNKMGTFRRAFVGPMYDGDPDIRGAEQISIDNYLDSEDIKHVHILHSDIQGAESEMLKTTIKHLNDIDYFFISTHGPHNHQFCLQFFKDHNFIVLAEHADVESCSGDGLVVAKRKGVAGPDRITIRKY